MLNGQHIHDILLGNQTRLGLLSTGRILRWSDKEKIRYRNKWWNRDQIESQYEANAFELISYLSHLSSQPSLTYTIGTVNISELGEFNQTIPWDKQLQCEYGLGHRSIAAVLSASTIQTISDMSYGQENSRVGNFTLADHFNEEGQYKLPNTDQTLTVLGNVVFIGDADSPYNIKQSKKYLRRLHTQGMIEYTNMYQK